MANFYYFYLLFPSNEDWFFPGDTFIHHAGDVRGYFTVFHNMEVYFPGSRIAQGVATHNEALRLSQMTSKKMRSPEQVNPT